MARRERRELSRRLSHTLWSVRSEQRSQRAWEPQPTGARRAGARHQSVNVIYYQALKEPAMTLPILRPWNIAFRTAHIGVTGVLFGGQVFGIEADRLLPWLHATIITGLVLVVLEAYPRWHWCCEGRGLLTLAKVLLACSIPWLWNLRVPILIAVIVLGSAGSHMPKRLRNYSIIGRPSGDEADNDQRTGSEDFR